MSRGGDGDGFTGIIGALVESGQSLSIFVCQYTLGTPQHDRHPSNTDVLAPNQLSASRVFDVNGYGRRVCHVS